MNEAELVDGLKSKCNFSHVESGNVLGKDFILDEHSHQISTRQELHEHVEESRVLEGSVQLDQPRTVSVGEDITLGADVCELILFELYGASVWSGHELNR